MISWYVILVNDDGKTTTMDFPTKQRAVSFAEAHKGFGYASIVVAKEMARITP